MKTMECAVENKNSLGLWETDPSLEKLPLQLAEIFDKIIHPAGLQVTKQPVRETESLEYGACSFGLSGKSVVFRVAKTTPTKLGQFVTIWKRETAHSEIEPFSFADGISFVMVAVFDKQNHGVFLFDKQILAKKALFLPATKRVRELLGCMPLGLTCLQNKQYKPKNGKLKHLFP